MTKVIIGIWLLSFFASWLRLHLASALAFNPADFSKALIGIVTYPLAMGFDPIGMLFGGLMLYQFGGFLERMWGMRTYLLFLLGVSVASLVAWELGVLLIAHMLIPMAGPWMLISATVVAWAWLNPEQTVLLYFVLPLKAKWIGWGTIALLVILYPSGMPISGFLVPILGIFALGGVGFAFAFLWYQRKWAWIPRRRAKKSSRTLQHPSSGFFGAITRPYREWQRRRRVARLNKTFKLDD